ncbi:MAG: hypothetical protein ACRED5_01755 [Propylenella sp.]
MLRLCSAWLIPLALLAISACVDQSQYLEFAGGGFIFNYRNATASYGIVLVPRRDPPPGAIIEASFEDPAGGDPIVLSRPARGGGRIEFETPAVRGVRKGRPYHVVVLLKSVEGKELLRIEKDIVSELDQTVLPERPLAIGPGYQTNIDRSEVPFPPSLYRSPSN